MDRSRLRKAIVVTLVATVASLGLLVAFSYRLDIRKSHARVNTGSHVVDTPCGRIEYALAGDRGPAVLVVHGAGGGFDQGLALGKDLATRGYRVVAMSRFGYLRTPLPADASAEAQADAHPCLLDALGIDRAAVIGASAGAPSSVQFALRHPRRTAALILPVPAIYSPRPGAALQTPSETPPLFETALRSDFLFWAATKIAHRQLVRGILATPTEVLQNANSAEQARAERILHDEAARFSAQKLPRARLVSYPSGGHVWIDHHEDVVDEVVRFLLSSGQADQRAIE